jgi:ERCC4-related helicase/ERCC4-type nuclease
MSEYVEHNLIADKSIEKREYQDHLSDIGVQDSTLVVLPTGTGKTIVTLRITAERLIQEYGGISLLLAPTKPLVEQHYETYSELLDIMEENIVKFTGDVRPKERENIWNDSPSVVIATPQVIENDLISDRISLENVIHLTFDECHRATGDYSYVYIADKYKQQCDDPLITGLSASPGDTKEDVLNICNNINVSQIEIVTEDDPMIEDYVYDTEIETRFVDISDEVLEVRDILQDVYKSRLEDLYEDDFVDSRSKTLSQGKLNRARGNIQQEMKKGNDDAYKAMSIWAEAMKLNRAIELIETQGVSSFLDYYDRLEEELRSDDSSKAVERLVSDPKVQKAVELAKDFDGTYQKFDVLRSELVNTVKIGGGKSLIFTKSRDTVESLVEEFSDDFEVGRLVGQSDAGDSSGMKQSEQKRAVEMFSEGEYEVLISTQIGEEGLDISEVDLVIFYEPATKGIEQIQRQGRTGRTQKGRVVMLIGQDTRDVGMYYKSKSNVEQMKSDVEDLQGIGDLEEEIQEELKSKMEQTTLEEAIANNPEGSEDIESAVEEAKDEGSKSSDKSVSMDEEQEDKPKIIADSRETNSSVVRNLDTDKEVTVEVESNMEVGDYVVSNDCVVERKDVQDFHDTITGERSIFEQVKNMSNSYEKPVLLIEGDHAELYTKNIHPNAVRGVLATVVSDFNTTIIESMDEEDTSSILKHLAKREQDEEESTVNPHGNKETGSVESQQEYIVSSIEGIGPKTSKKLLEEFGDPYAVFNADKDSLTNVEGVGQEAAKKIYSILRTEYKGD